MNYREKCFSSYVSTHTSHLYKDVTRRTIQGQSSTWSAYFGRFLPSDHEARIVDIGCGNGEFVHFLHQSGYPRAEGVDVSEEQVRQAKELDISGISCADLTSFLGDRPDAYSVIFARDVVEHLRKEDVLPVLAAAHRALSPGGAVVIQVPNGESPLSGRMRYADFTHEAGYTRSSLRQILSVAGFEDVGVHATGPVVKGVVSGIRFALWKIIECALRAFLLIETGSAEGIFTQTVIASAKKPR